MQQLDTRTRELGRSVDQLNGLSKVGETVSSSLDPQEVLSSIVKHAVELSGTEGGSIFEFDDESEEFQIRTAYGTSKELLDAFRSIKVGLHDTLVGRAALSGTSLAVPDIGRAPSDAHLDQLARAGWRSMLAVPLVRENRILGALVVRRRITGEFSRRSPTCSRRSRVNRRSRSTTPASSRSSRSRLTSWRSRVVTSPSSWPACPTS